MVKPKSLGRGLDSLISGASGIMAAQQATPTDPAALPLVLLDSIIPNPRQPRRVFREDDPLLLELRDSIIEHGLIQPIVVTRLDSLETDEKSSNDWFGDGFAGAPVAGSELQSPVVKYQIIAGERRWRASKLAKLEKVPVVIKDVTPQEMLELALIENIQRSDLNPIEEALAYQMLVQEYGLTHDAIAKQMGKSRPAVSNSLRLLKLPQQIREKLVNQADSFSEGHARAVKSIEREEDQLEAMEQIISSGMSVREAEEFVKGVKQADGALENAPKRVSERVELLPNYSTEMVDLEAQFREALSVKVELKYNAAGKGKVILHFNDQEELDRLYKSLIKPQEEP